MFPERRPGGERSKDVRYGVIRISPGLPPPEDQRRRIEAVGCDVYLEERAQASAGQGLLLPLLYRLKAGDELLVYGLEALEAGVGELARMFRSFNEGDVTLHIVGGPATVTLAPGGPTPQALALLADFEARHPTRASTRRRARAPTPTLSPYQLKFARDMQRRGYSMREIGLLFRLSPNEVGAVLSRADAEDADAAPPTDLETSDAPQAT